MLQDVRLLLVKIWDRTAEEENRIKEQKQSRTYILDAMTLEVKAIWTDSRRIFVVARRERRGRFSKCLSKLLS